MDQSLRPSTSDALDIETEEDEYNTEDEKKDSVAEKKRKVVKRVQKYRKQWEDECKGSSNRTKAYKYHFKSVSIIF